MNIRLHIQSPGFHLNAVLQAAALPALIELVQAHKITDINQLGKGRPQSGEGSPKEKNPNGPMAGIPLEEKPPVLSDVAQAVKNRFAGLSAEKILSSTLTATFPEKIVALTGLLQAKNEGQTVRPRDIKDLLVRARQDPPANPGRDFRLAWNEGWLSMLQAREFILTNSGWEKAGSLLS